MNQLVVIEPTSDELFLAENAEAIRVLGKRVVADIIEIGRRLVVCKKRCGHGNWLPWLDREFGWGEQTARNFMAVHEMALKSPTVGDLSLDMRSLYALAAPSTSEEARDVVIAKAQNGETLTHAQVKEMIAAAAKEAADRSYQQAAEEQRALFAEQFEAERERLATQIQTLTTQIGETEQRIRAEYDGKFVLSAEELDEKIDGILAPMREQLDEYEKRLSEQSKTKKAPKLDPKASAASTSIKIALEELSKRIAALTPEAMIDHEMQLARVTMQDANAVLGPTIKNCRRILKWISAITEMVVEHGEND